MDGEEWTSTISCLEKRAWANFRVANPVGQRPHRRDVSAPIRSETVTSSHPFPGLWHTRGPARIQREGAGVRPLRCVHDGAVATDGLPRSPSSVSTPDAAVIF